VDANDFNPRISLIVGYEGFKARLLIIIL
jgi:hypothetical protein